MPVFRGSSRITTWRPKFGDGCRKSSWDSGLDDEMENMVWRSACAMLVWGAAAAIGAPAQTYSTLVSFTGANRRGPWGALVQGPDGDLYGATAYGGTSTFYSLGCGSVFKMAPTGALTTLHFFGGPDGLYPYAGLVLGTDGSFLTKQPLNAGLFLSGGSTGRYSVGAARLAANSAARAARPLARTLVSCSSRCSASGV